MGEGPQFRSADRAVAATLAVVAALALLAVGCGGAPASSPSPSTAAGAAGGPGTVVPTDEGTPVAGGKLVFGNLAENDGLNPAANNMAHSAHFVASAIYDPLAVIDEDRNLVPYLAESITPTGLATEWIIKLRPGVTFHDGTPCDAAAVAANITAQRTGVPSVTMRPVKDVVVRDPLTVEVQMNQPWAAYNWLLATQLGYIASPKSLQDPEAAAQRPVGTGPFVFQEWVRDKNLTVTKNPRYWQPGKPHLDSIEFRVLTDTQAKADALRANDVDLILASDSQTAFDFRGKPGFTVVEDATGEADYVVLNAGHPPFDNEHARRALVLGTDRERVIDAVGNGILEPTSGPFPKQSPYYSDDTHYPAFDLAAAKAAVEAYTRETGKPLEITLTALPDVTSSRNAQLLQQLWTEIGAVVTIDSIEQTRLISTLISGRFQAIEISNFGLVDPDFNYLFWHSQFVGPIGQLSINFSHTADPELDAALDQGRVSLYPPLRVEAYRKVTQRLNDNYAYVWLYRTLWTLIARDHVKGLRYAERAGFARTDAKPWLKDLWIAK